jgi:hypothetical protein
VAIRNFSGDLPVEYAIPAETIENLLGRTDKLFISRMISVWSVRCGFKATQERFPGFWMGMWKLVLLIIPVREEVAEVDIKGTRLFSFGDAAVFFRPKGD